jgi:Domain of unknown function (DUF3425)
MSAFNPMASDPVPLPERVARMLGWTDPNAGIHEYWASAAKKSKSLKKVLDHRGRGKCASPDWSIYGEYRQAQSLQADHLLSLTYYNVFRALISIIRNLDLDLAGICRDDYLSPFSINADSYQLNNLPPILHPTKLQRTVPHHAIVDIFPSPQLRDNMLTKGQHYNDDHDFCTDLVGFGNFECDHTVEEIDAPEAKRGLIVWGDPFDVANWEVGGSFARKWRWFLAGAMDLEQSTNSWRSKRGEPYLKVA